MGFDCWCCAAKRMVRLSGVIVGKRAAEVLRVSDCVVRECSMRGMLDCLIGHELEGRWL